MYAEALQELRSCGAPRFNFPSFDMSRVEDLQVKLHCAAIHILVPREPHETSSFENLMPWLLRIEEPRIFH